MLWNYVMSLTEIYMTPIRKSGKRLIVQLQVLAVVGQEVHSAPKAALWQVLQSVRQFCRDLALLWAGLPADCSLVLQVPL